MPETKTRCAKCESEMEDGFLVDTVFPGAVVLEPRGENLLWVKGKRSNVPNLSWFSMLVANGIGFLMSSVQTRPVSTRRCVQCGYLELYA